MRMQYRELSLGNRGLNARFLKGGVGEPILYLHGVVGSKGWNPFLDILARQYTVFAPLQPGFEEVDGLGNLSDIVDLALYYFDLLDELGIERVNVVGHFLGAMVAAEMAALCPHYVDKLALLSPAGLWRDETPIPDIFIMNDSDIRANMWHDSQSLSALSTVPEQESEENRSNRLLERNIDFAAAGKFLWPIPDQGLRRRIHRIKVPVLLLWGEEDRIVPPVYAQEFSNCLENVRTVMLPNCGHLAILEEPKRLALEVGEFFD